MYKRQVQEVIETVWDTYQANPKYKANKILEKMVEPERVIMFRVPWIDDKGEVQINRGYRVQFNSAIGPVSYTHLCCEQEKSELM